MKTIFKLLGIRWWETTREYSAPEQIGAGYNWPGLRINRGGCGRGPSALRVPR